MSPAPQIESDLDLDVQVMCEDPHIPANSIMSQWVQAALDGAQYQAKPDICTEMTVRIVDTDESRELNATYRNQDKPTNVLSFGFEDINEIPVSLLGDLVICGPLVSQEATEQGKTVEAHWAHLLIHGTLHLLGYDHITAEDAELMEELEINILQKLGFPDPYTSDV